MKTKFIKLTKLTIFAAAACLLLTATSASASLSFGKKTLTFENLPGEEDVPFGYGSLNWEDFYTVYGPDFNSNGVPLGVVSGYAEGYCPGEGLVFSDYQFTFNSAYFTAAFSDNVVLEIWGYNGNKFVFYKAVTLSATKPTKVSLPNKLVTTVFFEPSGGTLHPGYVTFSPGGPSSFCMDNVSVTILPIPGQPTEF